VTSDDIPLLWSDNLRSIYVNNEFEPNFVYPGERDVKIANIVFYNEVSEEYIEEVDVNRTFRSCFLQAINMVINPPLRVHLDVGCGPGNILDLTTGLAETRIGIDISLRALRIARERTQATVVLGDADRLPIRTMSCQLVTASSVLHHLYAPPLFLAEAYRVLEPLGGLVTDCDPNRVAADFSAPARFLYSLRLPIYRCLSAFSGRFFAHRDRNLQRHNALAEYHNKPGCGFTAEELSDQLKLSGFEIVLVYIHNMNESAIVENSFVSAPLKHAMLQILSGRNPWNRSNGTTILSVSRRG
jgi:ubiquinone/menaquinone biosynthesis C-methylase UbiE